MTTVEFDGLLLAKRIEYWLDGDAQFVPDVSVDQRAHIFSIPLNMNPLLELS
jgi:hypothetical protein